MESAEKALNLFLEEDEEKAKQTAEELKEAGAVFLCDSAKEVADYIETL